MRTTRSGTHRATLARSNPDQRPVDTGSLMSGANPLAQGSTTDPRGLDASNANDQGHLGLDDDGRLGLGGDAPLGLDEPGHPGLDDDNYEDSSDEEDPSLGGHAPRINDGPGDVPGRALVSHDDDLSRSDARSDQTLGHTRGRPHSSANAGGQASDSTPTRVGGSRRDRSPSASAQQERDAYIGQLILQELRGGRPARKRRRSSSHSEEFDDEGYVQPFVVTVPLPLDAVPNPHCEVNRRTWIRRWKAAQKKMDKATPPQLSTIYKEVRNKECRNDTVIPPEVFSTWVERVEDMVEGYGAPDFLHPRMSTWAFVGLLPRSRLDLKWHEVKRTLPTPELLWPVVVKMLRNATSNPSERLLHGMKNFLLQPWEYKKPVATNFHQLRILEQELVHRPSDSDGVRLEIYLAKIPHEFKEELGRQDQIEGIQDVQQLQDACERLEASFGRPPKHFHEHDTLTFSSSAHRPAQADDSPPSSHRSRQGRNREAKLSKAGRSADATSNTDPVVYDSNTQRFMQSNRMVAFRNLQKGVREQICSKHNLCYRCGRPGHGSKECTLSMDQEGGTQRGSRKRGVASTKANAPKERAAPEKAEGRG